MHKIRRDWCVLLQILLLRLGGTLILISRLILLILTIEQQ